MAPVACLKMRVAPQLFRFVRIAPCKIRKFCHEEVLVDPEIPEETKHGSESRGEIKETFDKSLAYNISIGKYAHLADASALVEYEGTAVLATVVGRNLSNGNSLSGSGTPLTVHYHQKAAAIGRIPTNFLRKELAINDYDILTSRMIDRSLRPLFPSDLKLETQVVCKALALDGKNFPDVLAINAASAALACSDIPWNGPVAAVRIGLIGHAPIINPTKLELKESDVNLVVTGDSEGLVVMLEGSFKEILLPDFQKCLRVGLKFCKRIIQKISHLRDVHGKTKKEVIDLDEKSSEGIKRLKELTEAPLRAVLTDYNYCKKTRDDAIQNVFKSHSVTVLEEFPDLTDEFLKNAFYKYLRELYRVVVTETNLRCDGRGLDDIRPIICNHGLYDALHGSSTFKRGQTEVMCTVALDSPNSTLRMDKITMLTSGIKEKNFFVHYEFPAYAVGEIGVYSRTNRREIGHGALAERALRSSIPEDMPFVIRLTSEVLESNGSSSMATVCGGTLALLDAGIELNHQVAGVAMGLFHTINENKNDIDSLILTDISGIEDFLGDMDFKIAGSRTGITAIQLDLKVNGISSVLVQKIILKAKKALSSVLNEMGKSINVPRVVSKENYPKTAIIDVPPYERAKFIGMGGSNIKKLECQVGIEIIEVETGKFSLFATNQSALDEALEMIEESKKSNSKEQVLDFGGIYNATVVEMLESGVMVTLHSQMTPVFIHVSQLDIRQVRHPSALGFSEGSQFPVKYFGRDPVTGAMRLSRKALLYTNDQN